MLKFIIMLVILIFIFLIYDTITYFRIKKKENKILNDASVSEELKNEIKDKREKELNSLKKREMRAYMYGGNLIQKCVLENVYRDIGGHYPHPTSLNIYDDYISYEFHSFDNDIEKVVFKISYDDIIDAKCDTTENLTAMRVIALGVMAFAFKKKTYYTIITYKDDLTNSDQQLIFRVTNPINKDEFINNLLVKRNQYLMQHKKTV